LIRCKINISIQAGRGAIIERMRERDVGLNPFESELLPRKRFEKRRASRERMDRAVLIPPNARRRR
jgi:hypothetical protein